MQKGSVNKVVLVGHLGGDPETRFTPSGAAVAILAWQQMNHGKMPMVNFKIKPSGIAVLCLENQQN